MLLFAMRGLLRGAVSQAFAVLGLISGLWVAGWVLQSLGAMWEGAQPSAPYRILRWLAAVAAALATSSLLHWWGESLGKAVRETFLGWLDRPAGFALGAALGTTVVMFALLAALSVPWPRVVSTAAAETRLARPMMSQAARACSFGSRWFPGSEWLEDRFVAAARRAAWQARAS